MQVDWSTAAFDSTPLSSDFGSVTLIRLAEVKTALEERLVIDHYFDYSIAGASPVMYHRSGLCSVVNVWEDGSVPYPSQWYGGLVYINSSYGSQNGPALYMDTNAVLISLSSPTHASLTQLTDDGMQGQGFQPYFAHLAVQATGQTYSYSLTGVTGTSGANTLSGTGLTVQVGDILYIGTATTQTLQVLAATSTTITLSANLGANVTGGMTHYGYRELYASTNWINNLLNLSLTGSASIAGMDQTAADYAAAGALSDMNAATLIIPQGAHGTVLANQVYTVHPNLNVSTTKYGGNLLFNRTAGVLSSGSGPTGSPATTSTIPQNTGAAPVYINLGFFSFWPTIVGLHGTYELHPEYLNSAPNTPTVGSSNLQSFITAGWLGATFSIVCMATDGSTCTMQAYNLNTGDV